MTAPATAVAERPATTRGRPDPIVRAWVVFAVVAGVALRVALLVLPTGAFDADEAVVGLMARHMLYDREFPVFYWGQAYGGTLEPALSVPLFAILGPVVGAVKAVPLLLSGVVALLIWRLGLRTVGHRPGVLAAAAFFVWPANYLWLSTKARGFYWVCLALGLGFHLVALRIRETPARPGLWLTLGAVAGAAVWTSPQSLYYLVPGTIWLAAAVRKDSWRAVYSIPGVLLAGAPWLAFNLRNGFPSLDPPPYPFDLGYGGNTWLLLRQGIPVALGLHAAERWLLAPLVTKALYAGAVVLAVVGVVRRPSGTSLLVTHVVVFVAMWGLFPVSGVIGEGRYVMFLLPPLALLLANALTSRTAATVFLVVVAGLSVAGVHRIRDATAPPSPDVVAPRHMGPLIEELEARGIDRVHANYWLSYRIDFESRERIVASPAESQVRYEPYAEAVAAAPRPSYVFPSASPQGGAFARGLDALAVPYETFQAGDFTVVTPERRVDFHAVMRAGA